MDPYCVSSCVLAAVLLKQHISSRPLGPPTVVELLVETCLWLSVEQGFRVGRYDGIVSANLQLGLMIHCSGVLC